MSDTPEIVVWRSGEPLPALWPEQLEAIRLRLAGDPRWAAYRLRLLAAMRSEMESQHGDAA